MDVFLLQPDSVANLTLIALVVPFAAYLLGLREKEAATWWLIVHLASSALALLASSLFASVFWGVIVGATGASVPERVLFRLPYLFRLVAVWAYVQFAYAVLHDLFPREAHRARAGTALLVLSAIAVLVYNYLSLEQLNFWSLAGTVAIYADNLLAAGLYVWALVVFVRKWSRLRRSQEEQGRRAAEAYGFYALLTCAVVVSTAFRAGTQLGLPMPEDPWFLEPLLGIGFTFGLAFGFVNYAPRSTTFQVKLVGLTLTATLLALASAVAITAEAAEDDLRADPIPSSQAFRFAPDGRGGYDVKSTAIEYDAERGENIGLGDNAVAALALPFDFPFGGVRWDTVYAYSDGFVTVGGLVDASRHRHRDIHREDVSMIIPLHVNFSPAQSGGVFARIDPDRLVVTWHNVPHYRGAEAYDVGGLEDPVHYGPYPTTNRVQLVLHADGVIDMVYDRVMIPPGLRGFGGRGLIAGRAPGEPPEPDLGVVFREQMFVDFTAQPSFAVPAGTSVLEDFYVKYRRLLHERLRSLAWLIMAATVFVVLVVPQFYRWSLTRPLERLLGGMKRVDGGTLDVEVPVGVNDEIGRLTHHFNSMTGSLRAADAELRAYAEHLEERVEERTAELQAEKAKTEAQAEALAEQALRLLELDEAKSRFFANVSHELRTPLTLLLGPIRDALTDPARGLPPRHLPAMHRSAERLLSLVDELLDLARLDAGRLRLHVTETDLVALTRRTVFAFTSRAEREGLALGFEAEPERLDAYVDAERYEQVLSNLLTNAFKFTPSGGRVRVTLASADGEAILTVRDTGEGIPADTLPHVFERFRQADDDATRRHEGAGIGLALARELVTLHGGRIGVESEVGFGSTFTVRLPLGNAHVDPEALAETPPARTSSAGRVDRDVADAEPDAATCETESPTPSADSVVLVVEDHADMRAYLLGLLAPHYRVEEAEDGQGGLDAARRLADDGRAPDLVISDVMMPRLDGVALCHALKADDALSHVPVVLLTARADEESRLEGLGEGADDYLAKPFSAEELLARCENLIEVRRRLRARFSGEVVVRPTDVVVPAADATWLEEVKAVCESELGNANFGADWLADALGMSTRTLQRRLKAASGLTPGAFLRTLRLERAAQLLEQDAGGVAEVAAAVGYTEAESFSRAFRQGFGVPPSTYAESTGPGA